MNNIIDLNGEVYVLSSFLTKYGVNKGTIYNGLSRYNRKITFHYDHFTDNIDKRLKWIRFSSIPLKLIKRHCIPTETELQDSLEDSKMDKKEKQIVRSFDFAYHQGFIGCKKHYHGLFHDVDSIDKYAKAHAVLSTCASLNTHGVTIKSLYAVYKNWNFSVLDIKSAKTFYRRIANFSKEGVSSVVHAAYGKIRGSSTVNEKVFNQLELLYRDKKMLSGR